MTWSVVVPRGFSRMSDAHVGVVTAAEVERGATTVRCIECSGSGFWNFGPAGTEGDCVECKGTGRLWISL